MASNKPPPAVRYERGILRILAEKALNDDPIVFIRLIKSPALIIASASETADTQNDDQR
jgi:hypothetical protein